MKKIFFLFALLPMLGCGQTSKTKHSPISQDSLINKWLHAIVNIESRSMHEKTMVFLQEQVKKNIISPESLARLYDSTVFNSPISSGTAIFLHYHDSDFLITARHVLNDPEEIDPNGIFLRFILIESDSLLNMHNDILIDHLSNRFSSRNSEEIVISNLSNTDYALSSIPEDLGIISLSGEASGFAKTLYKRGYKPISIQDVDTVFGTKPGDDILLIGYPGQSAVLNKIGLPKQALYWESRLITIPVLSFGKVVDTKADVNFKGDIFNYFGFSGGPVISKGKLVGITSAIEFNQINTSNAPPFRSYKIYNSVFIKSSLILPLLKKISRH